MHTGLMELRAPQGPGVPVCREGKTLHPSMQRNPWEGGRSDGGDVIICL